MTTTVSTMRGRRVRCGVGVSACLAVATMSGCSGCNATTEGPKSSQSTTGIGPAAVAGKSLAPGEQLAVPLPVTAADPKDFGRGLDMVVDELRAPALAWAWVHPNGTSAHTTEDTLLQFSRWDGAAGAFTAPVTVAIGEVAPTVRPDTIKLAYDAKTHVFAVAYHTLHRTLGYATSSDGGAHWSSTIVVDEKLNASAAGLVLANGTATFAFTSPNGLHLRRGPELAATSWTETLAPPPPNGGRVMRAAPRVVLDGAGEPALAYVADPPTAYSRAAIFWRPGSAPIEVMNTNNRQNDDAHLSLAVSGSHWLLAFDASRDHDAGTFGLWTSGSADGTTWTAPTMVTPDGPHGTGFTTAAISASGAGALVFTPNGGVGSSETTCGSPKLSRSADLAKWSTCSPDEKRTWVVDYPGDPRVAEGPGDKLIVAFHTSGHSDHHGLAGGIWVFAER